MKSLIQVRGESTKGMTWFRMHTPQIERTKL